MAEVLLPDIQAHPIAPSEISHKTLGYDVIACDRFRAVDDPQEVETVAMHALQVVRTQVAELTPAHQVAFNTRVTQAILAEGGRVRASQGGELAVVRMITQEADDTWLEHFVRWNAERLVTKQRSDEIQSAYATTRANYQQQVKRAIRNGKLHEHALEKSEALDSIVLRLGDYMDMQACNRIGYTHRRADAPICIAEPAKSMLGKQEQHVVWHELTHRIGRLKDAIADEATTEHIALALRSGQWDTFNPYKHRPNMGLYRNRRRVLGATKVAPHYWTRAYTSHTLQAPEELRRARLDDCVGYTTLNILNHVAADIGDIAEHVDKSEQAGSAIDIVCEAAVRNAQYGSFAPEILRAQYASQRQQYIHAAARNACETVFGDESLFDTHRQQLTSDA